MKQNQKKMLEGGTYNWIVFGESLVVEQGGLISSNLDITFSELVFHACSYCKDTC